jgi:hypothetical protein
LARSVSQRGTERVVVSRPVQDGDGLRLRHVAVPDITVVPLDGLVIVSGAANIGWAKSMLQLRAPQILGEISYSIYIVHWLLLWVFYDVAVRTMWGSLPLRGDGATSCSLRGASPRREARPHIDPKVRVAGAGLGCASIPSKRRVGSVL